jgi:molybdate transport system permease protein
VFLSLETNPEEAVVLALVMVAVSFAVLVGLRDRWFGAATHTAGATP